MRNGSYICTKLEVGGEAFWFNGNKQRPLYLSSHIITRVTKTLVIMGPIRRRHGEFAIGTAEQIAQARSDIDNLIVAYKRRDREQAEREADPVYQLARRMNSDWRPFDKLTLEQLQTIDQWLIEAEERQSSFRKRIRDEHPIT